MFQMLWKSRYLHDGSDLLPLLWSRVRPGWVVRTGMEDKDGELGSILRRRKVHQLSDAAGSSGDGQQYTGPKKGANGNHSQSFSRLALT